eukprot:GHVH01004145.1.p1 GENE.GHVH01004145.1~~GHVH01004145.1.p1  ORF type:complete len:185 (+),score=27.97 GHVH01004145.1:347-901(+)
MDFYELTINDWETEIMEKIAVEYKSEISFDEIDDEIWRIRSNSLSNLVDKLIAPYEDIIKQVILGLTSVTSTSQKDRELSKYFSEVKTKISHILSTVTFNLNEPLSVFVMERLAKRASASFVASLNEYFARLGKTPSDRNTFLMCINEFAKIYEDLSVNEVRIDPPVALSLTKSIRDEMQKGLE